MLEWLIPIGLFWVVGAVYLGGFPLAFENGAGVKQVLGLLATYALFLAVWAGLRAVLGGMGGVLGRVIVPQAAVILLFPLLARAGFRVTGVRIRKIGRIGESTH